MAVLSMASKRNKNGIGGEIVTKAAAIIGVKIKYQSASSAASKRIVSIEA